MDTIHYSVRPRAGDDKHPYEVVKIVIYDSGHKSPPEVIEKFRSASFAAEMAANLNKQED